MAVKYRIEYCNKSSDTARLDIDVRGYSGQVYPIEGTGDLFLLEYKRTDDYILSTVADIQIFSDENFNIDLLKTSDETELKALFYVNNVLKWQGYILPDFFQTGIVGTEAISMTATDRLSILKDVALDYSLQKISYIKLISECLSKTGLSMNCNVVADFILDGQPSTFHIMECYVDHARVTNRNKYLSAWDVLRSILVLLNAQIVQHEGEWWIVNRYQLRNGGGRVFKYLPNGTYNSQGTFTPSEIPFTYINSDGRRSIEPVTSQASVFMEYGGARRYPEDCEFTYYNSGYEGWNSVNGFTFDSYDKEVTGYNADNTIITNNRNVRSRLRATNTYKQYAYSLTLNINTDKHLISDAIPIYTSDNAEIEFTANITGMNPSLVPISIIIDTKNNNADLRYKVLKKDGTGFSKATLSAINLQKETLAVLLNDSNLQTRKSVTSAFNTKINLKAQDIGVDTLIDSEIYIIIWQTLSILTDVQNSTPTFINEASVSISIETAGKGLLYRTNQGAGNYSKKLEADTTIFGDHLTRGINGYFYAYPQDELSIHSYLGSNIRTGWTSPDDTLVDPILLHSVRQRARINSIAKNILNITFSETFNPLAIYTCNNKSYVVRSAKNDFLRTRTEIELEENASQSLAKVDYIYTYFGDEKEKGITTLSGISGGGSSGGTASHTHNNKDIIDQLSQINLDVLAILEIDENDNLKVNTNLYSTGEVSAYGIGSSGGGGGGSTVAWGAESAGSVPLTVDGISKTLSLASHTHSGYLTSESDPTVPSWVKAITTSDITNWNAYGSQVHSHTNKSLLDTYTQTEVNLADAVSKKHSHTNKSILDATTASFLTADRNKLDGIAAGAEVNVQSDWNATSGDAMILNKPTTLAGYGILSTDTLFNNKYEPKNSNIQTHISATNNPHNVTKAQIGLGNVLNVDSYSKSESDSLLNLKLNKSIFDDLFEKVEISTGVWAIKAKYHFYGVGEVSAYGFGETGGGTGGALSDLSDVIIPNRATGDLLVYNGTHWVNQPQSSIIPNLTGYATESWSNNRFALKSHSHIIGDVTGLQTALDGKFNNPNGNTSQYIRGDGSIVNFPNMPQGTVTSVALTTPTGLTVSGSPITTSGTLAIGLQSGYSIPTTTKQTQWDTAYTHSQSEHQTIINGTGFVKANGKTLSYDNNSYSLSSHNHSGVYEPVFTKNTAFNKNFGTTSGTVAEGNHTHTKAQVGLSNVDNTSDVNKPISNATQTALNGKSNIGHTHNLSEIGITGLTTNYLTKFNGSTFVNSQIFDNGTNVGIGIATPTVKLDVNGTGKFKDDILMTFNEWSYNGWQYPTDKNSLNKFLKLFDIDTLGNLVVKTNLYSTGEVTAYKSGTGVSGLTLQGDMNANGKKIIGIKALEVSDVLVGNDPYGVIDNISPGVFTNSDQIIAAYSLNTGKYIYGNGYMTIDNFGLMTAPKMEAGEFKFGLWSFKEVGGNMVISYNGTAKATIQSSRINSNL